MPRNFIEINDDLNDLADKIRHLEKATEFLILSNENHLKATKLNFERNE